MEYKQNSSPAAHFESFAPIQSKAQSVEPFNPELPFAEMPRVSIVMPTLNERENLPHVLTRIPRWVHELVMVDGHSEDGTVETAKQLWPNDLIVTGQRGQRSFPVTFRRRAKETVLRLVSQRRKGKGEALRRGFEAATGDIVVIMDADGSNDPRELTSFVGALLAGADLVKGSRFLQGGGTADMSYFRYLGNWCFVRMVRIFFGCKFSDLNYGYIAMWRRLVPELQLDGDGFEIETMMNVRALKLGLKVAEVPSFEDKRIHGTSNLRTIPDGWRVLMTILRERIGVASNGKTAPASRSDAVTKNQNGEHDTENPASEASTSRT